MDADRPSSRLSAVSVLLASLCIATSSTALTQSNTAGHGLAKSSRGMSALAGPPVGPPVPPIPPVPFMGDPGARNMDGPPMEPPFRPPGPPNYMGMGADFGLSSGGQMQSSGLDGFPSAQQDSMTANQYTYPQNQPIPVTRNDDPYAYPYNMPKPAGLYSKEPVGNPQLTLGGFPYVKPADHDSFETFSPVTLPPVNKNGEYSYDWSFNSNANQPLSNNLAVETAPNSDEVLTVRDLMASPAPKVMPRQATPKPVTKRCTPDDIVGSSGICASRIARRAKCGGLVSSMSKDCGKEELCCFAVRKNNTIISVSVKQSQRQCVSPVAPRNPGFCSVIADRQKNCAGLVASSSPDCLDGQLCCFSATPNLIEIQIVGSPPKAALTSESEETACFPSIKPEVQGVCAKRTIRQQRCRGMLSATSNNCHQDELCCFFLNGTSAFNRNKQQISMQSGPYGQGGGGTYYQVPTYQTPATTPTTTSRTTVTTTSTSTPSTTTYGVTYPPSWYQGATTPYYFPYKPDRLCVPSTNPAVYDGTCVASSMIQYLCSGLQAGTSLNCGYNEYCCYTNKPISPPPAAYGCVPDNNPNIADGLCFNANDLSAKCSGISISTSRDCGITQFCCYSGKVVSTPGPYTPPYTNSCSPNDYPTVTNGRCVSNGQSMNQCNGAAGPSSQCQSNELCCYNVANNYGYPQEPSKTCTPQANKYINNGTCVSFGQIAQQCKGIQISPSLDCGYSQYCCYTSPTVEPPPSRLGCIPENNPTITNGTCVESGQISSYCKGLQISISSNCPIMSFCCYPLLVSTTTTTTSTTTPRTPPNTPTTYYVTAYPTPAPPAVTYAYPPSGEGCTPDNNPSVNNGFCVAPAQLTAMCKGIQIAPSKGCSPTYFCCYRSGTSDTTSTPTGSYYYTTATMQTTTTPYTVTPSTTWPTSTTTGITVYCSPETLSTVSNGKCVASDQLSTQCKGISIATSRDCPITTLCCFNATTAYYTYGTTTGTLGTTTTRPTATSSYYTPAPSPQPVTDSYYYKPSGAPYVSTPAPVANRSCSPQSNRQIKNGFCVSSGQISQKCRGIQISPSLDCLGEEYCCYQAPDVLDVRPGGACIPQSNPKILNGVCVDSDQIGVSCKGVQMSTSRNCKPTQFCCFNTNDAYAWGYGYQPPSQYNSNRQRLPAGSCKPNGRANTDNINGICVETSDIMVACKQWQVARSGDCQSSQYCCFSEDTDISTKVQRPQQLPNRDAVLLALASNSQNQDYGNYNSPSAITQSPPSQNQNYGSYYAPPAVTQAPPNSYSTYPDTTRTSPVTATITYTSTPTTRGVTYEPPRPVSYNTPPQTPAPTRSCRPMSYPSISNGICVASSQIGQACSGIQVSPSLNCYGSELCCFTNSLPVSSSSTTPAYVPYTTSTTTPATTTTYTTPTTTITTTSTTAPTTTPTTTSTTYTTQTSTITTRPPPPPSPSTTPYIAYPTPSITPSYSYGGYAPSSGQCIPDSMPVINNGRCIDQASLSDYCRGIQISTSRQCGIGLFCCFTMTGFTVPTGTPSTMSPNTPTTTIPTTTSATTTVTTAPYTTPTTSPTTTSTSTVTTTPISTLTTAYTTPTTSARTQVCNPQSDTSPSAQQGLCVAASMISVACNGLQLSTSLQCGLNEFCCYKPSVVATNPSAVPPGACIPDNYPMGVAGSVLCVDSNQLSQKCAGMELSTSRYCAADQMCCYTKSASFDPKAQKKISFAVNSECSPVSDRTQKGKCVPKTNLTSVCKKMQMSMSGDCSTGEFCCFQRNIMEVRPECVPSSDSSQKGKCVRKSLLPECKNMQMSMSDDCRSEEFCCFTRNADVTADARSDLSCSPETDPEITNGFCTDPLDVDTACQGAEAATSNNCQADQLCCFKKETPVEPRNEGDDPVLDAGAEPAIPVSWPRSL